MKKFKSLIVILTIMLVALTAIMPTISFAATTESTSTKYDENESITITVTGDVEGRTLEAYKLFSITEKITTTTTDDENNTTTSYQYVYNWANDTVEAYFNTLGITTVEGAIEYLSDTQKSNADLITFANAYYSYATAQGTQADATTTEASLNVTGAGYYLIYDATTADLGEGREKSATMLSNIIATENITVELKANKVEVEKTADKTSANVGDTVTFTVTSTVPDTTQYDEYTFVVTDTMSAGLDYTTGSVKVTIDGTELTADTDYTVSYENHVLTITFDTTSWDSMTDQEIVITYEATLNSTAATAIENTNSVQITYSNDPTTDSTGKTTTEEVKVYSYKINLTKKNVAGTVLEGAIFVLQNEAGKYYSYSETDGTTSWVDSIDNATTFTTNADGTVAITGIAAGTYTLVETVAPEGYYLPTSGFEFTIEEDDSESDTVASITESSDYLEDVTSATTTTLALAMTVLNSTTSELLPSTGGIGTTIFTIAGIAVMAIAVIALVARNRKSKRA